jgi:hypothetical protein
LPDLWNQLDLRLHVACELAIDLLEVGADGLEDLRQGQRRFGHSGSVGDGQSDHKFPRVSNL